MEGFNSDDNSQPVEARRTNVGMINWAGVLTDSWALQPQPKWERFRMEAKLVVTDPARMVRVGTICQDTLDGDLQPYLDIDRASFGASGNMQGDPQVTEVWVFPVTGSASVTPPLFSAPPATGSWSHTFVNADPEGTSRPGGGYRFSTGGPGLSPLDEFSSRVFLNEVNVRKSIIFSYDATTGNYMRYGNDKLVLDLPGVAPWGLVALLASLGGIGIWLTARRRASLA